MSLRISKKIKKYGKTTKPEIVKRLLEIEDIYQVPANQVRIYGPGFEFRNNCIYFKIGNYYYVPKNSYYQQDMWFGTRTGKPIPIEEVLTKISKRYSKLIIYNSDIFS